MRPRDSGHDDPELAWIALGATGVVLTATVVVVRTRVAEQWPGDRTKPTTVLGTPVPLRVLTGSAN